MRSFHGEDLGDDLTAYRTVFEPRNHETEAESVLYAPIRTLFGKVNRPVDSLWRERTDRYIDLRQFVTHVAIETFLSESDGVLGYAGMTNFYVYRASGTDRHRLIVWDKDQTFAAADSSISGHDHLYERFAPQDPDGRLDPVRGIRQFIVGTGGAELSMPVQVHANSDARWSVYGVLQLVLRNNGYTWGFVSDTGAATDIGGALCHVSPN